MEHLLGILRLVIFFKAGLVQNSSRWNRWIVAREQYLMPATLLCYSRWRAKESIISVESDEFIQPQTISLLPAPEAWT